MDFGVLKGDRIVPIVSTLTSGPDDVVVQVVVVGGDKATDLPDSAACRVSGEVVG